MFTPESKQMAKRFIEHLRSYDLGGIVPETLEFSAQMFFDDAIIEERLACMGLICGHCRAQTPTRWCEDADTWAHWDGFDGANLGVCKADAIRKAWNE